MKVVRGGGGRERGREKVCVRGREREIACSLLMDCLMLCAKLDLFFISNFHKDRHRTVITPSMAAAEMEGP